MTTNEEIFIAFVSGELKPLYDSMYASFLQFARGRLSEKYEYLAEDCVQDAILAAYRKRKFFPSFLALKSFIYTCIANGATGIHRKRKSYSNFVSDTTGRYTAPDLSNEINEQEILRHLFSAIDSLPPDFRDIFELSFEKGLSNSDVARYLGISVSTVKKRKNEIKVLLGAEAGRKYSS